MSVGLATGCGLSSTGVAQYMATIAQDRPLEGRSHRSYGIRWPSSRQWRRSGPRCAVELRWAETRPNTIQWLASGRACDLGAGRSAPHSRHRHLRDVRSGFGLVVPATCTSGGRRRRAIANRGGSPSTDEPPLGAALGGVLFGSARHQRARPRHSAQAGSPLSRSAGAGNLPDLRISDVLFDADAQGGRGATQGPDPKGHDQHRVLHHRSRLHGQDVGRHRQHLVPEIRSTASRHLDVAGSGVLRGSRRCASPDLPSVPHRWSRGRRGHLRAPRNRPCECQARIDPVRRWFRYRHLRNSPAT